MYSMRDEMSKVTKKASLMKPDEYLNNLLIVVQKSIFSIDLQRFENFVLDDLVTDAGYTFVWHSKSTESACPRCGKISHVLRHTYKSRIVIDEEMLGRSVTHILRLKQFICDQCMDDGGKASFVENVNMICRPYMKTTIALDERIVNDGINRSANGLARDYKGKIDVSRETILRRVKEAGGMATENRLTETEGVLALSVDDNNGRKGNPSTACTVEIDAETHNILVVAQGASSEVARKIFERFPDADFLSRDRACAYAKAGNECSLEQVADIFHLIQNAHEAVNKELSMELRNNIYIREGDGWVELTGNQCTKNKEQPVPIFTLAEKDITERVRLAHLSERQERKYRKVIDMLRLYDEGLGKSEISKRLAITSAELHRLLGEASEVVNDVESKVDEYFGNMENRKCRQKSIGKKAKHSSESIVEPYSDTVMRMVSEGHTHRTIHSVILGMGFKGSVNTVYQYILKKRHEESITNTERMIADEQNTDPVDHPRRPKRVSLQRVSKGNIYKYVLHEVSVGRKKTENGCADTDINPESGNEPKAPTETAISKTETSSDTSHSASVAPDRPHSAFYSDEVADILMRPQTQDDKESKKKSEQIDLKKLEALNPIIGKSITFLRDLHMVIDNADVPGLNTFISHYKVCGIDLFETYAKGLGEDFNAVKNAILNRNISNGPIEGINNKIKLIRRTRYGRAKIELINALAVLSSLKRFRYADYAVVKNHCATNLKHGCLGRVA